MVPTRRYRVAGMPRVRVHVADLGLACCAVEFVAAVARGLLVPERADGSLDPSGPTDLPGPTGESGPGNAGAPADPDVNVLIVSGTVTHALAPAVVQAWAALPHPRAALAFGACTISGGPYWDSYAVAPGIDEAIPVTRYVPGCPPRPEALLEAIAGISASAAAADGRG